MTRTRSTRSGSMFGSRAIRSMIGSMATPSDDGAVVAVWDAASAPAAGQYGVANGVHTFAADQGKMLLINDT